MWGPDAPSIAPSTALFQFSLAALAFAGIALTAKALTPESPVTPREYPYDGLVAELGGLEENKVRPGSCIVSTYRSDCSNRRGRNQQTKRSDARTPLRQPIVVTYLHP